jgi:hypothetical protein
MEIILLALAAIKKTSTMIFFFEIPVQTLRYERRKTHFDFTKIFSDHAPELATSLRTATRPLSYQTINNCFLGHHQKNTPR